MKKIILILAVFMMSTAKAQTFDFVCTEWSCFNQLNITNLIDQGFEPVDTGRYLYQRFDEIRDDYLIISRLEIEGIFNVYLDNDLTVNEDFDTLYAALNWIASNGLNKNKRNPITIQNRPNIIVIMTDDQAWGDTGYSGHPYLRTPNLDQMTYDGMKFNRFYSAAPICHPTRASLLTGRSHERIGFVENATGILRTNEETSAEMLRNTGYATGHFGKWAVGSLTNDIIDGQFGGRNTARYQPPSNHGFDEYFAHEQNVPSWNPFRNHDGSQQRSRFWTGTNLNDRVPEEELQGSTSGLIIDRAIDFIDRHSNEPFFTNIWLDTPHVPNVGTTENEFYQRYVDITGTSGLNSEAAFLADIEDMDSHIGRIRAKLEELGIANNTIIIFFSDNGRERRHGRNIGLTGGKRELYEGGIRVPGIAVMPGTIPTGESDAVIYSNDLFSTFAGIVNYELPSNKIYDGIDAWDIITGFQERRREIVNFRYYNSAYNNRITDHRAAIQDNYKILSTNAGRSYKLYNLDEDPSERWDVKDEYPVVYSELLNQWNMWFTEIEINR